MRGSLTNKKEVATDFLFIIIGALIYAVGVSLLLDPNGLAPGGVTGIAIILNRLLSIRTGTLYFLLNVPIVLLGVRQFGLYFIFKTAVAVGFVSVFTNFFARFPALTDDLLLASVFGALLMALGLGLVFKAGATTGGTDIIIKVLRKKYRHLKTGFLFQCTDAVIVVASGIVFKNTVLALYAMICVVIMGFLLDAVLYGPDEAKMMIIISGRHEQIAFKLMHELGAGVTLVNGRGGWTNEKTEVIICAVHKSRQPDAQKIIMGEDPNAFLIIVKALEIYGEGYKNIFFDKY